jgi:hypothetical protein
MSMDGMDEQYYAMQNFRQLLTQFNDSLRSSVANLEAEHVRVAPYWQDSWRKEYDAIWGPFEETMRRYINSEGPNYLEFLNLKSESLRRYLFG